MHSEDLLCEAAPLTRRLPEAQQLPLQPLLRLLDGLAVATHQDRRVLRRHDDVDPAVDPFARP
jgi:hypothetical protein